MSCLQSALDEQERGKSDEGRQCLSIKDLFHCGCCTEDPGNSDTGGEKEGNIFGPNGILNQQGPEQSCSQKSVIQSLVRRQPFRLFKKFGRKCGECFSPQRFCPHKHFEPKNIEMFDGDQRYEYLRECAHKRSFNQCKSLRHECT